MAQDRVLTGIVVDEETLTVDELAQACAVERRWVRARVEAGLLGTTVVGQVQEWRFASAELARARRLVALERDFDANEELAALVADLIEEVERLRAQLRGA
ncbi:MAG: chaperone modulator CbpM [Burkholderiaceae bacterium]